MRSRRHLGFVAAAATLLAAAPLSTIFERWTWLVQCAIAVALVAAAGTLTRWWRAPIWAQAIGMLGALLLGLTWMFPSGGEVLAVLPAPDTFRHFGALLGASAEDMRSYGVPVSDTPPLLFVTVLGVGAVAIVVDLLTVGLRRPALAGLPMLAIYSVPVAVHVDSVPAIPFVIGAVGFLWLLVADNVDRVRHFGRRFTGDGRDVNVWEPSPLAAAGRRLAAVGVVIAVLVPLAVPGMTSGLLNRFNSGVGDGLGQSGSGGALGRVNLFAALSGELNRSEVRDMVRVTTNEPEPYYLRFGIADDLRRTGFHSRTPSGSPVNRGLPEPLGETSSSSLVRSQQEANVEILDFNMPFLPLYGQPTSTRGLDANWLYDPNMQVLYSRNSRSKGKKYSFQYIRTTYSPAALEAAPSLPAEHPVRQAYTNLPEQVREVDELVRRLTADKRTDYDQVRAIYDHFSRDNGFSYSLSTEGGTNGPAIVEFLINKVGFCQQYATAMAWLVRAAGIPARVALGFTTGTNRRENTTTLTNYNLHAWTEVYFEGIGWVPFDPTPAASVAGSARTSWAPDIDAPDPVTPTSAPSAGPAVGSSADPGASDRPDRAFDEDPGLGAGLADNSGPRWPWWLAAALALLVVLLAVPALRRALLRRRRHSRATPPREATAAVTGEAAPGVAHVVLSGAELERARADAHAAWDELVDTMVDFRIRVNPAETPRATADRLVVDGLTVGTAGDSVRLLGRAEELARYARDPMRDQPLDDALRTIRRALSEKADRRTRILAATLPPSVLFRWRLAIMDGSGRFVWRVGRLREVLLRFTPHRLLTSRR